jgi:hypothetical protein
MAGLTSEATGLIKEMLNADGGLPNYNVREHRARRGLAQAAGGRQARATLPAAQTRTPPHPHRCLAAPRPSGPISQEDLVTRTLNMTGEYSAALGKLMR